jgi:diacylglycerol kinase family enzyme
VATCGGDGTNLSTVTELMRSYGAERLPIVALLRGGTVNTVAQNLGVHGRPEEILQRLVARLDAGGAPPTVEQELVEVRPDGGAPLYGFLFAAAMGARFLQAYYGGPLPGMTWALALTARTVASCIVSGPYARWLFSPVELELTIDGERATDVERARLLLAATVRDVGLGMKVTWQAGRRPGRFNLIASELSTPRMAAQLHRVRAGLPLAGWPHLDCLARRATVRFAAPQTFTLDGELFRTSQVELTAGPRLRVARV